jgi:CheY-like chemotaxis protein
VITAQSASIRPPLSVREDLRCTPPQASSKLQGPEVATDSDREDRARSAQRASPALGRPCVVGRRLAHRLRAASAAYGAAPLIIAISTLDEPAELTRDVAIDAYGVKPFNLDSLACLLQ